MASTKLDYAKYKAEKKLRKALLKLDRKHRRHGCVKRRWLKLRNSIKGIFGVSPQALSHHHQRGSELMKDIWSISELEERAMPKKGPLRRVFKAAQAVRRVNLKLSGFEAGFISERGIKDREWYRHLGVAPGKWLGYGATTFPALSEALDERNSTLAAAEAERLAELISNLVHFLKL